MMQSLHLNILLVISLVGVPRANAFLTPLTNNVLSSSRPLAEISHAPQTISYHGISRNFHAPNTHLFSAAKTLSLQLEKPLGLILEEDGESGLGVIVTQVNEGGSAYQSPDASKLIGSKIQSVTGNDVSALSFDDVMDVIVSAESPLHVVFALKGTGGEEVDTPIPTDEEESGYTIGTDVLITVKQPEANKPDIILNAKVGDNLRKTLLNNKEIELYRGIKKKLGNCGGGGQCGFCAVELIDDEGCWGERSDYEAQKIGKNGSEKCRLACMNNIAGPAVVKTL
jgi:ferredoxin